MATPARSFLAPLPATDRPLYEEVRARLIEGMSARAWQPGEAIPSVGSSRVDLQACKLEYSIVSPK